MDRKFFTAPLCFDTCFDDEFLCQICTDVMTTPTTSGCASGHVFCKVCIHRWLQEHETCPVCRGTSILAYNTDMGSIPFSKLIDRLPRVCEHYLAAPVESCHWTGRSEEYAEHVRTCGFVKAMCLKCHELVLRKNLDNHGCPVRTCDKCGTEFLGTHECPEQFITCPIQGCKVSGKRSWITSIEHTGKCTHAHVKCDMCKWTGIRKNLDEHMIKNISIHMGALWKMKEQAAFTYLSARIETVNIEGYTCEIKLVGADRLFIRSTFGGAQDDFLHWPINFSISVEFATPGGLVWAAKRELGKNLLERVFVRRTTAGTPPNAWASCEIKDLDEWKSRSGEVSAKFARF